jgi:hypothetical protein
MMKNRFILTLTKSLSTDKDFYDWLCGFVDGEGCFYIKKIKNRKNNFQFLFLLELHINDLAVLEYIKDRLEIGNVKITKKTAKYEINNKESLKKLISIFNTYPLNTIKQLNFLDFKKAFELYNSLDVKTIELTQEIEKN